MAASLEKMQLDEDLESMEMDSITTKIVLDEDDDDDTLDATRDRSATPPEKQVPRKCIPCNSGLGKTKKSTIWYGCPKCNRCFEGSAELVREHLLETHGMLPTDRVLHGGDNKFVTVGLKSPRINAKKNSTERHLCILNSKIHGQGLFSGSYIAKDEIIVEYTGELLSNCAALRRQHLYDVNKLEHYILKVGKIIIDATVHGNCSKYINHSCDPNCVAELVPFLGRQRVLLISNRNIVAGEELTFDYQFTSDELIPCFCGASACRLFLNSNLKEKLKLNNDDLLGLRQNVVGEP